jgi:hypothetical protein
MAHKLKLVSDRASDIYGIFAPRPTVGRAAPAAPDRSRENGGRLLATTDALSETGRARLDLPARPSRPAR